MLGGHIEDKCWGAHIEGLEKSTPPPPWGMFHRPVSFIVAVQNETSGCDRSDPSRTEQNQYGNISRALIRDALIFRGHSGATAAKWGIGWWSVWSKSFHCSLGKWTSTEELKTKDCGQIKTNNEHKRPLKK